MATFCIVCNAELEEAVRGGVAITPKDPKGLCIAHFCTPCHRKFFGGKLSKKQTARILERLETAMKSISSGSR